MIVCDPDWPEPKDAARWTNHLIESLSKTIEIAGGRTLGLFASWKSLHTVYDKIKHAAPRGVQVYRQDERSRLDLIRRFNAEEKSVLLGVESFWAGIDAPGRTCSAVWIEKLPFAPPDDPILNALDERLGRDAFYKHSVPDAILKMRQGFGRLIRSMSDAGIVVIADPRILTAGYGERFTSTLPEACRAGDWEAAAEHLRKYFAETINVEVHTRDPMNDLFGEDEPPF
jgi:ATP-dependent DNA helicase DinG